MSFRAYFLGSMISGVILSSASGYQAVLVRDLFDSIAGTGRDELNQTLIIVLAISLVVAITRYWTNFTGQYLADLVTVSIRQRLQRKLLKLNLSFHGAFEKGSGGLMSRILNDVVQVQIGLHHLGALIREPILFIVLFTWLMILDWQLTLGLILVAPAVGLFSRAIAKRLHRHNHKAQAEMEGLTENIKETLDGVRVIQSFNLEKELARRFDEAADRYLVSRKKIQSSSQAASPITEYIATLVFAALFLYFASEYSKLTSLGDFMGYLTALLMLSKPVTKLQDSYVKLQSALVSGERVYEILENIEEQDFVSFAVNVKSM